MFRGSRIPSIIKNDRMLQKVCCILLEIEIDCHGRVIDVYHRLDEVDCHGRGIDVYHRLDKGSTVMKFRGKRKPSEIPKKLPLLSPANFDFLLTQNCSLNKVYVPNTRCS